MGAESCWFCAGTGGMFSAELTGEPDRRLDARSAALGTGRVEEVMKWMTTSVWKEKKKEKIVSIS